jgi:hypothetical protein
MICAACATIHFRPLSTLKPLLNFDAKSAGRTRSNSFPRACKRKSPGRNEGTIYQNSSPLFSLVLPLPDYMRRPTEPNGDR